MLSRIIPSENVKKTFRQNSFQLSDPQRTTNEQYRVMKNQSSIVFYLLT